MKALKKTMLGAAALAAIATMAMASPAAAQFYAYPHLTNGSADDVTITGVSWSGSYIQIPTPVPSGQTKSGTYHTVLPYGSGGVSFTANITTPGRSGSCYFTFNVDNGDGTIYPVGHVKSGDANCDSYYPGYGEDVYFSID